MQEHEVTYDTLLTIHITYCLITWRMALEGSLYDSTYPQISTCTGNISFA